MSASVSEISKFDERLRKLKEKEKRLKQQEMMASEKKLLEIGRLAVKANISEMNHEVLYGAFLEISKKKNDEKFISTCTANAKEQQKKPEGLRLAISFKEVPQTDIKEQLKKIGLKWNNFRGEFYGICGKTEIEKILKNIEHKVETF